MYKNVRHKWSYEENKFCCDLFRDYFIIENKSNISLEFLFKKVNEKFPDIKYSSFRMLFQNYKQICIEYLIKDYLPFGPLKSYSNLSLHAFKDSLKEVGIKI